MLTARTTLLLAALALLLHPVCASAHTSLESNATFFVRPTGIDVTLCMSRGAADILIAKGDESVTIIRANFASFQDRLAAIGPTLLSLTTADGTPLKSDASSVSLTEEDDISYQLHFPLPSVLPAAVTIQENYLDKMDEGHIGDIYIMNAAGDPIEHGELRAPSPAFQAHLPAATTEPAQSPNPADTLAPSSFHPSDESTRWLPWSLCGGGLLVITFIALRKFTRQGSPRH